MPPLYCLWRPLRTRPGRPLGVPRRPCHERARSKADREIRVRRQAVKAEGEGFEPSIRLTTDNGFRDRLETVDLQGFEIQFASGFASQRPIANAFDDPLRPRPA